MLATLLALLGPIGKLFTGIDINSIIPSALNGLKAFAASVIKYWQYYLIATLGALLLLSYHQWQADASSLKIEKAAHVADITAFKTAQAQALVKAQAEKKALIIVSEAKANAADQNYTTLYSQYRVSLLRYKASGSTPSRPSSSEYGDTTQSSDGPSSSTVIPQPTEVMTISLDDANICAINTARLQTAHDWAIKLKETINAQDGN